MLIISLRLPLIKIPHLQLTLAFVCSRFNFSNFLKSPPPFPEIPKMSRVDSDSSPPSLSRDWFFPSPSPYCVQSSSAAKTPKHPRRFSTNPRAYSSSTSLDSKPPTPPSFRSAPPVNSSPYREASYAGARRRLGPSLRTERLSVAREKKAVSSRDGAASRAGSDRKPEAAPAEKVPSRGQGIGDLRRRLRLRWRMAFLVAVRLLRARVLK